MKLLVATEFPANASGGGPAVVRQMLRGFPPENLVWWSCLPEHDARFGQITNGAFCAALPRRLLPQRRFGPFKSALLEVFWAPYARTHLRRTIRQTKPDAIWVIPHNWSILPLAAVILGVKIGFHVSMHDYVDVHGHPQKFGAARCQRMSVLADHLYECANTRDAISQPMIADLAERTKVVDVQIARAGLEAQDFGYLEQKRESSGPTIRIAYAGTILVQREFSLFVAALDRARAQIRAPVSLEFFGAHSYSGQSWFDARWMREHGNLPEPKLLSALRSCTWGFSPMSLADDDPRYNRFSLPTKFVSYLAAGLPVFTLGHPESSLMRMSAQYSVGLGVGCGDLEVLTGKLLDALSTRDPWQKYGSEIIRCARAEFDAQQMRARLHNCFQTCVNATRTFDTKKH